MVDEGRRGVAVDVVVGVEAPSGWRTDQVVGFHRGFSRPRCTNAWADALLGKGLSIGLILMAHQVSSAPLLYTNGAPVGDAPLVWKTLMAHQTNGAPLVLIFFPFFHTY